MKAIVIGAGARGRSYASFALKHPDKLQIVGVAEPNEERRNKLKEEHNIPDENCFESWEQVFKREKFADSVFICTQDKMHFKPTIMAAELKYHVLLEKPMSPSPSECMEMVQAVEKNAVKAVVCHVLRYSDFFIKIKNIIMSGEIGEIVSVVHNENISTTHMAHSFVRGNYSRSKDCSSLILAKSCHDTDILQWLIGKKCLKVTSFGSLKFFNEQNRPKGAPLRCTDGCPLGEVCPYDARKLYFEGHFAYRPWFRCAVAQSADADISDEHVLEMLKTGPYGKCVFMTDNDVVDHQVVNFLFEDGITAMFSLSGFTPESFRTIKIMGTKGQIRASEENNEIEVTVFSTCNSRLVNNSSLEKLSSHGGGDEGIISAFCDYIDNDVKTVSLSTFRETAQNHMISFAAEESRKNGGQVVKLS